MALLFRRWDVDEFLKEIPHETYRKWVQFVSTEPQGWQAIQLVIQRLSYITAQSHSAKLVKESDFLMQFTSAGGVVSAERLAIKQDMDAAKGEIAANLEKRRQVVRARRKAAEAKAAKEQREKRRKRRGKGGRKNDLIVKRSS